MTREEYQKYLQSDHWKDVKERFRQSKRPKHCLICNNEQIELHHVSYSKLGNERIDRDIVPLCRNCHQKLHDFHNEEEIDVKFFVIGLKKVFNINRKQAQIKLKKYPKIWNYYKGIEHKSRTLIDVYRLFNKRKVVVLTKKLVNDIIKLADNSPNGEQFKLLGIHPFSGWKNSLIGKTWTKEFFIRFLNCKKKKMESIKNSFNELNHINLQ